MSAIRIQSVKIVVKLIQQESSGDQVLSDVELVECRRERILLEG